MDKKLFFEKIEGTLFNGRLSPGQRNGMEVKLAAFDERGIRDDRWRAYMLATSYHETARAMLPVEETGKGRGKPYGAKRKHDGTAYTYPDQLYYGRGDVQLTWYENYERMGKILGIPLLARPGLALDPVISARIMIEGMTRGISNRGDFTGVSLEDYFNDRVEDPGNARRVINGLDKSYLITRYYRAFLAASRSAMAAVVALLPVISRLVMITLLPALLFAGWGCKPARVVTGRVVTRVDSTAVHALMDSLYHQTRQVTSLQSSLKQAREENTRLTGTTRQHVIRYDTTAPADTLTGKHPVLREVITTTSSRYEKTVEDEATRQAVGAASRESLTLEQRSQASAVEKHAREDRSFTGKTASSRFNLKLFLAGVAAGLSLGIIALVSLNRAFSRFRKGNSV
jgi:predicted DNA-binding ribbon-helix-helix protein